jgi:hypothetical protein
MNPRRQNLGGVRLPVVGRIFHRADTAFGVEGGPMRCTHCDRPMLALFTSYVCEYCEGGPHGDFFRGWVVYPDHPSGPVQTWVFRSRDDAARWRNNRSDGQIRAVLSREPYAWTKARGTLKDAVLAEKPFEIYTDHRHPPGKHRAFLAPEDAPDADRIRLRRSR